MCSDRSKPRAGRTQAWAVVRPFARLRAGRRRRRDRGAGFGGEARRGGLITCRALFFFQPSLQSAALQARHCNAVSIGIRFENARRQEEVELGPARLPIGVPEQPANQWKSRKNRHTALRHVLLLILKAPDDDGLTVLDEYLGDGLAR